MRLILVQLSIILFLVLGCKNKPKGTLPILGETTYDSSSGEIKHYLAPEFEFINQSNQKVTHKSFEGKIQVIDFFFTSCPTICPKMTKYLKKVQNHFKTDPNVALISFSIDPDKDTPERLRNYIKQYNIEANRWEFLTGYQSDVFEISKDYKVKVFDDKVGEVPNLIHDGTFVLVDADRRIRGYYNGLELSDVNRLIKDINSLLY